MSVLTFFRLARCHKPVGTLLLLAPTAWALWIANRGHPPVNLIILFLSGTLVMRAAGCVMNDIADRHIDSHVSRTKTRPLACGEVRLPQAFAFLLMLLLVAALILLQLPSVCFYYAVVALLVTLLYPFCKRFLQCPQLVLGIAFSMGIPMAFAASQAISNPLMFYLLAINIAWIIAYDTEYAMADREDDLRIGVKSSAILFASWDRPIIAGLQAFFHLLWIPLAFALNLSGFFYGFWLIALAILIYQQWLLASCEENKYLRAFSSNSWYGLLLWFGIILG